MAILWQKIINNTNYEVRSAGQTRRLYTDGVFHSQFNPKRAITGGVWDLLMLPALFLPQQSIQRVLVLGVGGGAVIHQLHRYVKAEEIIGVELNPVHIKIAKQHFGITTKMAKLIQADAIKWLEDYSGPPFDLIIEDLFGEEDGEPSRAIKANKLWLQQLHSHLSPDGILIMNFTSRSDLKNSAAVSYKKISALFKSIFQFTLPNYENAIGAFIKQPVTSKLLHHNINAINDLYKSKELNFQVRKLK